MSRMQSVIESNFSSPFTIFPQDNRLPLQLSTRRRNPGDIPRSASRAYSPDELATARLMLNKLRRREDVAPHVFSEPLPASYDADRTLDAVVDRLLNDPG